MRVKNPIAVNGIGPTPKNETKYKNFNPNISLGLSGHNLKYLSESNSWVDFMFYIGNPDLCRNPQRIYIQI